MMSIPVFIFMLWLGVANSAKILLMPGPATSHCIEMISIGDELLKRGHQVTLFSILMEPQRCISKLDTSSKAFQIVSPKGGHAQRKVFEETTANLSAAFFARASPFEVIMKSVTPMMESSCDVVCNDMELLLKLRQEKFDIALIEGIPFMGCFYAIPVFLKVPVVSVGSFIDHQDSRTPMQTNTFPSMLTEYSNEMSFIQRTINTLLFIIHPLFRTLIIPIVDMSKYGKELAGIDTRDLIKDSVLFIENTDYLIDYPKAVFPNFIQVGGLTGSPAKPLPKDFSQLLDGAKNGAVLVTFGSMLKDLPPELKEKLMTAFSRLKQTVIFKQDADEVRGNVKVFKWLPQNDILGHHNTKLFISHCGKNGFWEGVYHGVPIICMAIHAETYTTKVKVMKLGIGSSINIFDDTVDELVEGINSVLNSETINKKMKRISTLLRDRPETPRQRAASAIEHVIKYGGEHLRPPSVNVGFISYTNLDVLAVLFGIVLMIVLFFVWIVRRCCCRQKTAKRKTE